MLKRFVAGIIGLTALAVPVFAHAGTAHAASACPANRAAAGSITYVPQTGDRQWNAAPVTATLCPGRALSLGSGTRRAKVTNLTLAAGHRARFTSVIRFGQPRVGLASATTVPPVLGSNALLDVTSTAVAADSTSFVTAQFVTAN